MNAELAAGPAVTAGVAGAPLRVVLADPDPRVRSALRLLVEQELGAAVCGETASAEGVLASVQAEAPDLLVLDWDLACCGAEGAAALVADLGHTGAAPAIVALGSDPAARRQALAAGVDRFVGKVQPPERVLQVLRRVAGEAARRAAPEGGKPCQS